MIINAQLISLRSQLADSTDGAATVELDQSRVGRLSRMDALQAQAMQKESLNRARRQVLLLEQALVRLDNDDFGWCTACGEKIADERLKHNPAATLCITCAERKEKSALQRL